MNTHTRSSRGFTLVELLVVISIIVILTGVIISSLSGSRAKARDAQRISDLNQIQLALALFVDRCGEYPTTVTLTASVTSTKCPVTTPAITLGTYIAKVPQPPAGSAQTDYDYNWYRPTGGSKTYYVLHAKLEAPSAAASKGLDYASIQDPDGTYGAWRSSIGSPQSSANPPWNACSNAATSVDYCISPN